MTLYDFIFTKEKPDQYYRHIAFWFGQCLFWGLWATVFLHGAIWEYFVFQLRNKNFFILDICYTYITAYYLSPKFLLSKQRARFFSSTLLLTVFTYVVFILYMFWIHGQFNSPRDNQLLMVWFFSMSFITSGPPIVCAMFLTFKILKNYYIKMQQKFVLIHENANAELQLLKAQVHPHFIFNTLNNIYSFALNRSPEAGDLVLKLSDTIRYMINDCEAILVPLEKELKMIEDYMGLEKVRYGKRLDMQVEIHGDFENKLIAPLLMIPFVENSFKHGTSQMLRRPWVKLEITMVNDQLFFKLSNSKPSLLNPKKQNGRIGLLNVKKRLQLLYPGKHQLDINETEDTYTVNMQILLGENVFGENKIVEPNKALTYA